MTGVWHGSAAIDRNPDAAPRYPGAAPRSSGDQRRRGPITWALVTVVVVVLLAAGGYVGVRDAFQRSFGNILSGLGNLQQQMESGGTAANAAAFLAALLPSGFLNVSY
jgi:hypothetical protein